MTREEAIEALTRIKWVYVGDELFEAEKEQAIDIAIEALNREPSEDEPQDDLISRAKAIETIEIVDWYHQNSNKDMVHGANDDEHQAWYKAQDIYKALEAAPSANRPKDGDLISRTEAIEALGEEPLVWCDEDYEIAERDQWRADIEAIKSVPSADRQMVIKCKPFLSEEDFKAFAEQASDQNVILISNEAEVVSTNTSTKSTNISTDASADRPRGEWVYHEDYKLDGECCYECSECGRMYDYKMNYCGYCGSDMRPTERSEE